jgi:hypothetical protein
MSQTSDMVLSRGRIKWLQKQNRHRLRRTYLNPDLKPASSTSSSINLFLSGWIQCQYIYIYKVKLLHSFETTFICLALRPQFVCNFEIRYPNIIYYFFP